MADRWLYNYQGGQPHAWSNDGKNYYLSDGGAWWAWESQGWLYAAQGGAPLGWFDGKTFYSMDGKPLYYFGT
ncbi:MAG TPA: hypothetical protein VHO29_04060 [Marmoricola sp.]|nr:hypothetical protein [Marmoricola sp.]